MQRPTDTHVPIWADEAGPATAPLVVVIHGSMDRSTGMVKLSRQLDRAHRVARYDRRGYGRSVAGDGRHPGPFDMGHQVADLLGVLAGRHAVLVGHSFGGNIALALAAAHPSLVRAVALYESPLSWEPWWPGNTAGAAAVASAADPEAAAEVFMRRMVGDARWEALPERTRRTRRLEGAAMVAELADLREHRPWAPEQITCPVIAGHGELGSPHHQRGMRHVAEHIAGARLVVVPGCRHDAPLSHAALFAERMVFPLLDAEIA
ncbi:MAG: alpha/beta hydrolase [Acidimicrobiales bacterium]|nr:alpha/beta hydrolase [Acidimicrobiales bacterium]MCB9395468.1 alpha/beta hydrolase [Acidimicrobiaceae bacterium]